MIFSVGICSGTLSIEKSHTVRGNFFIRLSLAKSKQISDNWAVTQKQDLNTIV